MEQQEQSAINAAVVPAEVAALISRTTESNTLRVPQYLHDALHELVGGTGHRGLPRLEGMHTYQPQQVVRPAGSRSSAPMPNR